MNELDLRLQAHHFNSDPLGYLVVEANIDNRPMANFSELAIDLYQFQQSVENEGEYFILTCWCGDPSCANIQHGIVVNHGKNSVLWQVMLDGELQTFEFSKEAYLEAQERLLLQARELLTYLEMSNDGELTIVPIRNRSYFNFT